MYVCRELVPEALALCGLPRSTTGAVVLAGINTLLAVNLFALKEREVYGRLMRECAVPTQPTSLELGPRSVSEAGL